MRPRAEILPIADVEGEAAQPFLRFVRLDPHAFVAKLPVVSDKLIHHSGGSVVPNCADGK